ncbi:MAG: peptide chain release factor N(5)-glutamine methyltransferase [bacterium]|nr:peptide chain release factor N(5)-glutamine methyltransferase [Gammaproteobacteria bacterium]HIL95456.1 peptide chain release factor N(5)-glutamine methyltransferase [Pseudomonadales bacterium]
MTVALQPTTVKEALRQHTQIKLSDTPLLDCQILLAFVLQQSRTWLYAHDDYQLTCVETQRYQILLDSRTAGKPVAYITGIQEFWSLDFHVTQDTLIPRPETELIVETLLNRYTESQATVIDLGTGAGPIAISLAYERPEFNIFASDKSLSALQIARSNDQQLNESPVHFVQSDWLEPFKSGQFDIIVCNPPYVDPEDSHLKLLKYEPADSLVSGNSGMKDIERITCSSPAYLKPGGMILLEHGYNQQFAVQQLLKHSGYTDVEPLSDLSGQARAVLAYKPL